LQLLLSFFNLYIKTTKSNFPKEIEKLEAEKKEIEDREELRFQVEQWAWLRCLTLAQNLLRHTTKVLQMMKNPFPMQTLDRKDFDRIYFRLKRH
jgi:hypothetical protein